MTPRIAATAIVLHFEKVFARDALGLPFRFGQRNTTAAVRDGHRGALPIRVLWISPREGARYIVVARKHRLPGREKIDPECRRILVCPGTVVKENFIGMYLARE
jgi:hypothetical protein